MAQGHRINEIRRRSGADRAIVFFHGFSGSHESTWASFPTLIDTDNSLNGWDIISLGYSTSMLPDIRGVWSADPDVPILALHLITRFGIAPLEQYRSVAIVAHSMGGLVVQRALLDNPDLVPRVSHVVFFGTPSGGLVKAGFFAFLKPQLRNMAADGSFVRQLRHEWTARFDGAPPFELLVVAGDRDQFVPPQSSLEPFPVKFRRVVAGDHLSMIKATDAQAESLRLLVATLGRRQAEPPAAAAPLLTQATEMSEREVEQAIADRKEGLTQAEVVNAAIRLDLDGKRPQAIELLQRHQHLGADVKGTLGGRYKRLWLESGDQAFAHQALELYREGLRTAEADRQRKPDEYHEQVYYHAINLAFMAFVAFGRKEEAIEQAQLALRHCALAPRNVWRVATEAEARLYLGEPDAALATYREVVRMRGEPWQLQSAGQQAYYVARKLENEPLQEQLRDLFNPKSRIKNRIFVSYSHRNRDWLERLQLMMSPYLRNGELEPWDDTRIAPGRKWLDEINAALRSCKVAVLLVSKEFLASDFIRDQELPVLLAAADRGEVKLLWLHLSPALYEATPLNDYQAAHDPARTLASLSPVEQDQALKDIAKRIKQEAFD